jgi:hypothetical protein
MKKVIAIFLLLIGLLDTDAQGVIELSNINTGGLVTLNGKPVGSSWQVSFALPDGTLLGTPANILAEGYFSGGPRVMDGVVGQVDLSVAAWDTILGPGIIGFSEPFNVTLGNMDNPASIPQEFSGVHIVIPEPSTLSLALVGLLALGMRYKKSCA